MYIYGSGKMRECHAAYLPIHISSKEKDIMVEKQAQCQKAKNLNV